MNWLRENMEARAKVLGNKHSEIKNKETHLCDKFECVLCEKKKTFHEQAHNKCARSQYTQALQKIY